MSTHPCPVRRCPVRTVPDRLLMCYADWARVPPNLQTAVYRAYNRGAWVGSDALREAQLAAIDAVNALTGPTP